MLFFLSRTDSYAKEIDSFDLELSRFFLQQQNMPFFFLLAVTFDTKERAEMTESIHFSSDGTLQHKYSRIDEPD